jgi:hypothetical protein
VEITSFVIALITLTSDVISTRIIKNCLKMDDENGVRQTRAREVSKNKPM